MEDKAHEYAIMTTNTRCSHMGRCDGCAIRFCDYKSRYHAFLTGASFVIASLNGNNPGKP